MNRCVLKTFGKKMARGTLKVVLYGLAMVAIFAVLILVTVGIGDRWMAIIGEALELTCLSSLVLIIPLAVGSATLEALKDSYEECGG